MPGCSGPTRSGTAAGVPGRSDALPGAVDKGDITISTVSNWEDSGQPLIFARLSTEVYRFQ